MKKIQTWLKCVKVSSKFENIWFMFSTIGKLLQYILVLLGNYYNTFSNNLSLYAVFPSYRLYITRYHELLTFLHEIPRFTIFTGRDTTNYPVETLIPSFTIRDTTKYQLYNSRYHIDHTRYREIQFLLHDIPNLPHEIPTLLHDTPNLLHDIPWDTILPHHIPTVSVE
jgi:hypothetical protein